MICAQSLVKNFGDFRAVDGLDLEIRPGECFGLLGPNGAGKSTFIGMVYGQTLRSSGSLQVFGMDPELQGQEIKKRLGVVTQENALDESLSVWENVMIYAAFLGVEKGQRKTRAQELLEYLGLAHRKEAPIRTLSGGMKRRLVFVRALLGGPELLILDEPTTGLDPAVRHLLWGKVQQLRRMGTTILLTTHYMHEAEVLCDRLVILNKGKIVAQGAPQEMIQQHTPGFVGIFSSKDKERILEILRGRPQLHWNEDSAGIHLRALELSDLTAFHSEFELSPLQIRPSNLEDVFLKLTGEEIAADA